MSMAPPEYQLDARGQTLGRLASQAAIILRGKNRPDFDPRTTPPVRLTIINAAKLKLAAKKLKAKSYLRYSGYPGGLRRRTLPEMINRRGYEEPLRLAIRGMLPANKLRAKLMRRLKINA